jgi:glycosyltransferase involved in cell wall biosynthesis
VTHDLAQTPGDNAIRNPQLAIRNSRVLVLAEACNPDWTSVPLEGWSHYRAIARLCDAHLVTQVRNREAILKQGLNEGKDFTAIDTESVAGPMEKLGNLLRGGKGRGWTTKMALMRFRQGAFEKKAWETFEGSIAKCEMRNAKSQNSESDFAIRNSQFEIIHQLTPLSPTIPPKIASWCKRAGVPFVWGPINGGLAWPPGYAKELAQEREFLAKLRGLHRFLPGYHAARRDASAILIGSRATWDQMPERYRDKCFYLPENAIDPARFTARRERTAQRPIRCVFLGRLVPYKGAMMLLRAIAPLLKHGDVTLDIVGDGPQRAELEAFSRELPGVTFHGNVDHARVQHVLAQSDLLTFPSIREFGGAVACEAMAVGCVPVVPAYGGLGEIVTHETGFLLPMAGPDELVASLRELIARLVANPHEIDERSPRAIARAREVFTWDAKAEQVKRVYAWLLGKGEKPATDLMV